MKKFDYIIVGAGLSGLVAAEQLVRKGKKKCLVVEKRNHIAGNCYDCHDENGVLIHKYGPHYFRTNSQKIVGYLSEFTEWIPTEYRVLSKIGSDYYNFPINLNTFEQIIGRPSSEEEMIATLDDWKVPIASPQNSEEVIISQVGWKLYEMFFKGYTIKQWKKEPKDLDASVCGRMPIRTNRDDRYLKEDIQVMPKKGYTKLCENIIQSCGDKLEVRLECDFHKNRESFGNAFIIYTGMIDRFYDFSYGRLPYRSLRFETEHVSGVQYVQPQMQINYPSSDVAHTRTVEIKHATQQDIDGSTIIREFPDDYTGSNEAYYPIPNKESKEIYERYSTLADKEANTMFIGRLGTYRYYNMDQCIAMALSKVSHLINNEV